MPVSIDSIILPPFGGKYKFRILIFKDGSPATSSIPLQTDIFTMDIEVPELNVDYLRMTSRNSADADNLIYTRLRIGIPLPSEGAIVFNNTIVDNLYENSSGWPIDLGQTGSVGGV